MPYETLSLDAIAEVPIGSTVLQIGCHGILLDHPAIPA